MCVFPSVHSQSNICFSLFFSAIKARIPSHPLKIYSYDIYLQKVCMFFSDLKIINLIMAFKFSPQKKKRSVDNPAT